MRVCPDCLFLALAIIYLGDIIVRAYGLSLGTFLRSRWNLFDVFTVSGALITTVIVLIIGQMDGSASQQAAGSSQKVNSLLSFHRRPLIIDIVLPGLSGLDIDETRAEK